MGKVLVVTRKDDPHADLVISELVVLGVDVFRLNTEAITEYAIELGVDGGKIEHLEYPRTLDLSDVGSVYLRRRSYPYNLCVENEYKEFAQGEWVKLMRNIWAVLDGRYWINHPFAIEGAKDKLRQLQIARREGFTIPDTIMSNSLDAVRLLKSRHEKIIYKAFDGGALYPGATQCVYATILEDENLDDGQRDSLRICPGIFQDYHDKDYELRVTIVGDVLFAAKIDSQASDGTKIDWRKGDLLSAPHSEIKLEKECECRCLAVMKKLGLEFGAMDLIKKKDGTYVFLEINANGQWAWIQGMTGMPIAQEIALVLAQNMRNPS